MIVQYLDHYEPQSLLCPETPQDNISARLIETIADSVYDTLVLIFLKIQEKKL